MTLKQLCILYSIRVCEESKWNQKKAALKLGIAERTLRLYVRKARDLGIIKSCPWSRKGSLGETGTLEEITQLAEKERQRMLDLMDNHFKRKYKVRGA